MIEFIFFRIVLTLGLSLLAWSLYQLIVKTSLDRVDKAFLRIKKSRQNKVTVIYFTTPDCVACKAIQNPVLKKISDNFGDQVQVLEINAYEEPDLAKEWGVLSVPTTFILDKKGTARKVNFGVTSYEKLVEQINL